VEVVVALLHSLELEHAVEHHHHHRGHQRADQPLFQREVRGPIGCEGADDQPQDAQIDHPVGDLWQYDFN